MNETYCGKSCEICGYRAETGCRGCLEQASQECELARGCREKGYTTCPGCTDNTQCGIYQSKGISAQSWVGEKKEDPERQAVLKQRGSFLSKWIWVLFWLFVPQVAAWMIQWMLEMKVDGNVLNMVCTAAYGVILLQISSQEREYSTAGVLTLAAAGLSLATIVINQPYTSLVISVASAVIAMMGYYYEFNAHADVLEGVDNKLSQQWRKLWSRMLGAGITFAIGVLLTVIIIGLLLIMAGGIAILVISILKLVYLFRTAQTFQDVAAS